VLIKLLLFGVLKTLENNCRFWKDMMMKFSVVPSIMKVIPLSLEVRIILAKYGLMMRNYKNKNIYEKNDYKFF